MLSFVGHYFTADISVFSIIRLELIPRFVLLLVVTLLLFLYLLSESAKFVSPFVFKLTKKSTLITDIYSLLNNSRSSLAELLITNNTYICTIRTS